MTVTIYSYSTTTSQLYEELLYFNCTVSPLATENPHYSVEGCYLSASPPPSSSVPQCR
jgi:hypothetical protein